MTCRLESRQIASRSTHMMRRAATGLLLLASLVLASLVLASLLLASLLLASLGCQAEPVATAQAGMGWLQQLESPTGPPPSATAAWPAPATRVRIPWLPTTVRRHRDAIETAAARHGIDAELVAIVTLVESGGWIGAVSPTGARGLMQVMPATGAAIAEARGLVAPGLARLGEPAINLDYGAYYLGQQLTAFATVDLDEAVSRAAGAYNGGPTAFRRFLHQEGELSDQTKRYRRWVGGMWRERRMTTSATFAAWKAHGGDRLLDEARAEMSPP